MATTLRYFGLVLLTFISVRSFGQNGLDYFIERAVENAPQLKTNNLQSAANELDTKKSVAGLTKPVLGTEVNYLRAPAYLNDPGNSGFKLNPSKNAIDYYGYDLSATNGGLYQGLLSLDQTLFNKARIDAVQQQMAIQNEILSDHSALSEHELRKQVTDQYIICLQDMQQQQAVLAIKKIIEEQLGVTQKLSAGGLAKKADSKILEIELQQQESSLRSLDNSYKVHLLQLYSICGLRDTGIVKLDPLSIKVDSEEGSTSGFTNGYRLDSLSLGASQKVFAAQYKPTVSLYSSAGLNAVYAPDIYKRFGWQVGIRLTKTFFDGHQKDLNEKRVRLLQQASSVDKDFFNNQNETRKKALLQMIYSFDEQLNDLRAQIKEYEALMSYYQKQMVSGQSSVIDYLTVLRSSTSLQLNRITLETQRLLAINNYNYWNW